MGKINSIISFTGKTGEVVGMKGQEGQTYLRKMAVPANPRTQNQIEQRLKMSLAGQLSKMVSKDLIYGMGTSTRSRRSNFTANIVRSADIDILATGEMKASLLPNRLMFSDGIKYPISGVTATLTTAGVLTATIAELPVDVAAIIVVGVFAQARGNEYQAVKAATLTSSQLSVTINGGVNAALANIYLIPVLRADGATSADFQRAVNNIESNDGYEAIVATQSAGVLNYAASQYNSTVIGA